ncbi:hypothetical protein HY484_01190 [Candidatus Woesearchaeota archaeon]|nr:hypothetical protein [Candidatus Woesearchaeota archaeon]
MKESIAKDNWQFIFYKDIERFYDNNIRKKEISTESFDKLFRMPKKDTEQKQNSLHLYL